MNNTPKTIYERKLELYSKVWIVSAILFFISIILMWKIDIPHNSVPEWILAILVAITGCTFALIPVVYWYYKAISNTFSDIFTQKPLAEWSVSAQVWESITKQELLEKRSLWKWYILASPLLLVIAIISIIYNDGSVPDTDSIVFAGIGILVCFTLMYLYTFKKQKSQHLDSAHITLYKGCVLTPKAIHVWQPIEDNSKTWFDALSSVLLQLTGASRELVDVTLDSESQTITINYKPDETHSVAVQLPYSDEIQERISDIQSQLLLARDTGNFSTESENTPVISKSLQWVVPIFGVLVVIGSIIFGGYEIYTSWQYDSALEKGNELMTKQDYASAIEEFDKAIEYDDDKSEPVLTKAQAYSAMNKYSTALETIKPLTEKKDVTSHTFYDAAVYAFYTDSTRLAYTYIQLSLQGEENNGAYWFLKGDILLQMTSYDSAIIAFRKSLKLGVKQPADVWISLANAFDSKGLSDSASVYYQKAIKANPKNPNAYYHKAVALKNAGRIQEAIESFEQAKQLGLQEADEQLKKLIPNR
ncbi:MAG: tetratricopeptide repeat protein [Bacteroidetes bacterium]|nr:tetratricopeptide repeat protein [Bacteroidota bacterium]